MATDCGNSGVPLDLDRTKLTPDQLGPPGSDYRKPGAHATDPSYLREVELYRPRGADYATATGHTDENGRYVISEFRSGLYKSFPSRTDAAQWLIDHGLLEAGKGLARHVDETVMALRRNAEIDRWAAASPLQRVIGMATSNFIGNTEQAAQAMAAMDWARRLSAQDKWSHLLEFLSGKRDLSPEELRALMPERGLFARSVAWTTNKVKWARVGYFANQHILGETELAGQTPLQRAAVVARAESERQRIAARMNGNGSVLDDVARHMSDFLSSQNLTWEQTIDEYRMARFTLERAANLERQYRTQLKPHLPSGRTAHVIGKDAAGKPLTEVINMQEGLDDLESPYPYDDPAYRSSQLNPEAIAELRVRYQNRGNPTQFEWQGKTGVEGAKAYLASLDPEQAKKLANANHIMNGAMDDLFNDAIASGAGGLTREAVDRLIENERYYIPQQEELSRSSVVGPYILKGRDTAIDNPTERLWTYLEALNRTIARNAFSQEIFHTLADAADRAPDLYRIRKEDLRWEEGLQRWVSVRNAEDRSGFVWFPPPNKGEAPVCYRVDFSGDAANPSGKAKKTLEAEKGNALHYLFTGTSADSRFLSDSPLRYVAGANRFLASIWTTASPTWIPKSLCYNLGVAPGTIQSAFGLSSGDWKKFFLGDGDTMRPYMHNVAKISRAALSAEYRKQNPRMAALLRFAQETGAGYGSSDTRFNPLDIATRHQPLGSLRDVLENAREAPVRTALTVVRKGVQEWKAYAHAPDEAFTYGAFISALEMKAKEHGEPLETLDDMRRFAATYPDEITWASNGSRRILPNFSDHGNYRTLNALIPFFNASVQTLPMIARMASTPTGRTALGLSVLLGFYAYDQAFDEHGEGANRMTGGAHTAYLGHGAALPMDYAYAPFMALGRGLAQMTHGQAKWGEVLGSTVKEFGNSVSPVQLPEDTQPWMAWAVNTAAPPILQWPLEMGTRLDRFGRPNYEERPVDAYGHALVNPSKWQTGRAGDSVWSTQIAKWMDKLSGGIVNLSPADVGFGANQWLTPLARGFDVAEGGPQSARGERPTALGSASDLFFSPFKSRPQLSQGRAAFADIYKKYATESDTKNTLRHNPRMARLQALEQAGERFQQKVTIRLENGQSLNRSGLRHRAQLAARNGDFRSAAYWRAKDAQLETIISSGWYQLARAARSPGGSPGSGARAARSRSVGSREAAQGTGGTAAVR